MYHHFLFQGSSYPIYALSVVTAIICTTYYWYRKNKTQRANDEMTGFLCSCLSNVTLGVVNRQLVNKIPVNGVIYSEKDGINHFNSRCGVAKTDRVIRIGDIVMMESYSTHTAIMPIGKTIYNL